MVHVVVQRHSRNEKQTIYWFHSVTVLSTHPNTRKLRWGLEPKCQENVFKVLNADLSHVQIPIPSGCALVESPPLPSYARNSKVRLQDLPKGIPNYKNDQSGCPSSSYLTNILVFSFKSSIQHNLFSALSSCLEDVSPHCSCF